MNWYKQFSNPDADIYGWPEMESAKPTDESFDLFWNWIAKDKKQLQGMAAHAEKMKNLALKAMHDGDEEKFTMYTKLLEDWRDKHSERVWIPDGGKRFEVNMFEDGSMW